MHVIPLVRGNENRSFLPWRDNVITALRPHDNEALGFLYAQDGYTWAMAMSYPVSSRRKAHEAGPNGGVRKSNAAVIGESARSLVNIELIPHGKVWKKICVPLGGSGLAVASDNLTLNGLS